jgi:hypothetical protein
MRRGLRERRVPPRAPSFQPAALPGCQRHLSRTPSQPEVRANWDLASKALAEVRQRVLQASREED